MMFICPISGMKMRVARAKGGSFWYCRYSRSRLLTLEMAKHFLTEDATREIWVRSERIPAPTTNDCPSCSRTMRSVTTPGWMGRGEIDVCRSCHLVWIQPDTHPQIPHPEDLLVAEGDSTLYKDSAQGLSDFLIQKEIHEEAERRWVGEGPEGLLKSLPAFLGMPVEMNSQPLSRLPWLTIGATLAMFLIHAFFVSRNPAILQAYGYYPANPFEHGGLNILTSTLLHGGWFHFLTNLYFFWLFSDNVEDDLGIPKYLGLWGSSAVLIAFISTLISARPEIPHVGLSGILMAIMTYYSLQFPKARIAYIFPYIRLNSLGRGGMLSSLMFQWIRIPCWIVLIAFVLKDFLSYQLIESVRTSGGGTSYSSHLSGAVSGFLFWLFFSKVRPRIQPTPAFSQKLLR